MYQQLNPAIILSCCKIREIAGFHASRLVQCHALYVANEVYGQFAVRWAALKGVAAN